MSDIRLFRQALALSSGTVSYLIDCTLYSVVDVVQREFAFWCLRNPHHENWIQAWKEFERCAR
jgi:hypothetical protein